MNEDKLEQLKTRLKELKKEEKKEANELKQDARYQKIQSRYHEIEKRLNKIDKEIENLEFKARERIISADRVPSYSRAQPWTNIRQPVLDAIKQVVPLSHLKDTQIEEIARRLIDKEKEKYPQIGKLELEQNALHTEESKVWDEERRLERKLDQVRDEIRGLENHIEIIRAEKERPYKSVLKGRVEKSRSVAFTKIDEIYKALDEIEK